jgi:hypothetical protein
MGRLQNNPSIGWVHPKSTHALFCIYETFCYLKLCNLGIVPGPQQGNFLEISKISSHFQESYEIAKIFGGFCQICSLFLLRLPYLANRF